MIFNHDINCDIHNWCNSIFGEYFSYYPYYVNNMKDLLDHFLGYSEIYISTLSFISPKLVYAKTLGDITRTIDIETEIKSINAIKKIFYDFNVLAASMKYMYALQQHQEALDQMIHADSITFWARELIRNMVTDYVYDRNRNLPIIILDMEDIDFFETYRELLIKLNKTFNILPGIEKNFLNPVPSYTFQGVYDIPY